MLVTEQTQKYAEVVAMAWADESFKTRLMDQPHNVLQENGIAMDLQTRISFEEGPISDDWQAKRADDGGLILPFPKREATLKLENLKMHGLKTVTQSQCCHGGGGGGGGTDK